LPAVLGAARMTLAATFGQSIEPRFLERPLSFTPILGHLQTSNDLGGNYQRFTRALICLFTIAGSVFLLEDARAQADFHTEIYAVPPITLSTADFCSAEKDGKPAMIAGELRVSPD